MLCRKSGAGNYFVEKQSPAIVGDTVQIVFIKQYPA